jgi:hypothetical protein
MRHSAALAATAPAGFPAELIDVPKRTAVGRASQARGRAAAASGTTNDYYLLSVYTQHIVNLVGAPPALPGSLKEHIMVKHGRRLRMLAATAPIAVLFAVACGGSPAATAGAAAASGTTQPSSASPPPSATGVCGSGVTCFTPQQLQAAYAVKPLLDRGIDGRGETVVLPELAESQPNPPQVTDLRQDMTAYDGKCLTSKWCTRSHRTPTS